jgi:outer membrane cobalamin receptor
MKLLEKTPCDTIILYDFADFSWYLRFMSEKVHDGTKAIWFTDDNEETRLKAKGLVMEKMTFEKNKMINVQGRIEKMVQKNYAVHRAAREAYRDYILSVVEKDCHKVAKSFGLDRAPLVNGLRD